MPNDTTIEAKPSQIGSYDDFSSSKVPSTELLPQNIDHYAKVANAYKRGGEDAAEEVIETIVEKKQRTRTQTERKYAKEEVMELLMRVTNGETVVFEGKEYKIEVIDVPVVDEPETMTIRMEPQHPTATHTVTVTKEQIEKIIATRNLEIERLQQKLANYEDPEFIPIETATTEMVAAMTGTKVPPKPITIPELNKAVKIAGSRTKLGKALGFADNSAVSSWYKNLKAGKTLSPRATKALRDYLNEHA